MSMRDSARKASVLPVAGVRPLPLVAADDGEIRLYHPATGRPVDLDHASVEDLEELKRAVARYRRLAQRALEHVERALAEHDNDHEREAA